MSAASDANADIKRIDVTPRFADIVVHGGIVHAVEVPPTETGDIEAQTAGLLEALEKQLVRGGSDKSRILCATIYLTDMADYAGMNKAWESWLPAGCAPSRACVRIAGLAREGWKVEVAVQAAVKPAAPAAAAAGGASA